jgi:transposase
LQKPREHQYVGIDVAKAHLDVHFHPEGDQLRVANDEQGWRELSALFAVAKVKRVVMESTGSYSRDVDRYLRGNGISVFIVVPQRVKHFASAMGVKAKTDKIDASVIARFAAVAPFVDRTTNGPDVAHLHDLISARQHLVAMRTANINFTKAQPEALRTYGLEIRGAYDAQLKAIDSAIADHVRRSEELKPKMDLLVAMTGIGPTVGATLLGCVPELGRCSSKEIASLVGLAPFNNESGGPSGKKKQSIRGGRKRVRTTLYMAARVAVRYDDDLTAFFDRLRKTGKPDKVALTAVMRKLVVRANARMRDYMANLETNQLKAA